MNPKILIITTYSDEAQINDQKLLVQKQQDINSTHLIIEGLNKVDSQKEFHRLAYTFKEEYDFVIKLDADMVPEDELALSKLVQFAIEKKVDRLTMPVFDFFTNSFIMGVHIIRASKVPENHNITKNNTDGWIGVMSGERYFYTKCRYVNHAFNPSLEQSVRYGLHRGLKSRQDPNNGQWITLILLFKNWNKNRNTQVGYALLAALYGLGLDNGSKNIDLNFLNHNEKNFRQLCSQIEDDFLKNRLSDINLQKKISFLRIHFMVFRKINSLVFLYLRFLVNYFKKLYF